MATPTATVTTMTSDFSHTLESSGAMDNNVQWAITAVFSKTTAVFSKITASEFKFSLTWGQVQ